MFGRNKEASSGGSSLIPAILILSLCFWVSLKIKTWSESLAHFLYNDPKAVHLLKFLGTPYDKTVRAQYTNEPVILALYQTIKDIHDACESIGIEYWPDGGTLLGLERHDGIIPWDDDADLIILSRDLTKLKTCLLPALQSLGYTSEAKMGYIKISSPNPIKLEDGLFYPFCDIFILSESDKDGKLFIEGWDWSLSKDKLRPRIKRKFGEIEIWTYAESTERLIDLFGKNWSSIGMRGSDHLHKDGRESSAMPFLLQDKDRSCAKHMGSLLDNSKLLRLKLEKIGKGCLNQVFVEQTCSPTS